MADKLGILPSGNSEPEYISLSDRESEVSPSETLDNFKSDKNTINEIITVDNHSVTINDPGYVDLSSLTALKNVQPDQPGAYPIEALSVQFSADDKKNLENIIKKLVSVAHSHSESISRNTPDMLEVSCSNQRICEYFDCDHGAGRDCNNNGNW